MKEWCLVHCRQSVKRTNKLKSLKCLKKKKIKMKKKVQFENNKMKKGKY